MLDRRSRNKLRRWLLTLLLSKQTLIQLFRPVSDLISRLGIPLSLKITASQGQSNIRSKTSARLLYNSQINRRFALRVEHNLVVRNFVEDAAQILLRQVSIVVNATVVLDEIFRRHPLLHLRR